MPFLILLVLSKISLTLKTFWPFLSVIKIFFLFLGSREAAYLSAISAASVAYAVTRACSKGELAEQCSCDMKIKKRKTQKWKWGGCSDDIRYTLFYFRIGSTICSYSTD